MSGAQQAGEMGARRITNTWLIDHDGQTQHGDFILNTDGSYAASKGDEDVLETIDGADRLITRSFQNWHTHLAMILNRGMGEGLPLMEWLESAIFPVETRLKPQLIEIGTRAAAAEMIATGTTFACDMYFHTGTIGQTLAETGVRAILCGPITDGITPNFAPGSGDALRHMENLISDPRFTQLFHRWDHRVCTLWMADQTRDENTRWPQCTRGSLPNLKPETRLRGDNVLSSDEGCCSRCEVRDRRFSEQ